MELLKRSLMVLAVILLLLIIWGEIKLTIFTQRADVVSLVKAVSVDIYLLNQNGELLFKQHEPKNLLDLNQDAIHNSLAEITETEKKIIELEGGVQKSERFGSISKKRYVQLLSLISNADSLTDEYKKAANLLHGCTLTYNELDAKQAKKIIDTLQCRSTEFTTLAAEILNEMKFNTKK